MNNELFKKAIEHIASEFSQLKELGFHGFGEIEMKSDFPELICWARKRLPKTHFAVSTTLSIKSNSLIDKLLESCLDSIGIWPDGFSEDSYQKIRTGGSFVVLVSNLKYLLQQRKGTMLEKTAIHVGMIRNKINDHCVDRFMDEFNFVRRYKNVSLVVADSHDWAGQIPARDIILSTRNSMLKISRPCFMPFTTMVVAATGVISICCMDMDLKLQIGDIRKGDSLKQAWTSPAAESIRKGMFLGARPELCRNCEKGYWTSTHIVNKFKAWLGGDIGLERIQQAKRKERDRLQIDE